MSRFRGDIAIELQTVTYWLLTACNQVQMVDFPIVAKGMGGRTDVKSRRCLTTACQNHRNRRILKNR